MAGTYLPRPQMGLLRHTLLATLNNYLEEAELVFTTDNNTIL